MERSAGERIQTPPIQASVRRPWWAEQANIQLRQWMRDWLPRVVAV
jgi:hypothetical protein